MHRTCASRPRREATWACSPDAAPSARRGSSWTSSWRTTTCARRSQRAGLASLAQLELYPLRDLARHHQLVVELGGLAAVIGGEDQERSRAQLEAGLERVLG